MGIVDNVKEAISVVQKLDNVELYQQLLGLQCEIQSIQGDNLTLRSELAKATAEVKSLQEKLAFSAKLVRHNNFYFEADDGGSPMGIAYCSNCWEVNKKAVHLVHVAGNKESSCPNCKTKFNWMIAAPAKT